MEKCVAVHPEALDVLCGSGLFVRTHQGNLRLQRIIKENFDAYFNAPSRPCMSDIVHSIVREVIHGNGVRKSRVLKKEAIFSYWYVVAKKKAPKVLRDKITSCLRDMSKKLEAQVTPLRWNDRQMHPYGKIVYISNPSVCCLFVNNSRSNSSQFRTSRCRVNYL